MENIPPDKNLSSGEMLKLITFILGRRFSFLRISFNLLVRSTRSFASLHKSLRGDRIEGCEGVSVG